MIERKQLKKSSGKSKKRKGASYERKVCQRLSLWASNMTREDVFWRSAMSGGRATLRTRRARGSTRKREVTMQEGDISAIHACGHKLLQLFLIECKAWNDLKLDYLFWETASKKHRAEYWDKPRDIAAASGREPLCVLKQDNRDDLILTSARGAAWLEAAKRDEDGFPCYVIVPRHGIYVYLFQDLLMDVDYDALPDH